MAKCKKSNSTATNVRREVPLVLQPDESATPRYLLLITRAEAEGRHVKHCLFERNCVEIKRYWDVHAIEQFSSYGEKRAMASAQGLISTQVRRDAGNWAWMRIDLADAIKLHEQAAAEPRPGLLPTGASTTTLVGRPTRTHDRARWYERGRELGIRTRRDAAPEAARHFCRGARQRNKPPRGAAAGRAYTPD